MGADIDDRSLNQLAAEIFGEHNFAEESELAELQQQKLRERLLALLPVKQQRQENWHNIIMPYNILSEHFSLTEKITAFHLLLCFDPNNTKQLLNFYYPKATGKTDLIVENIANLIVTAQRGILTQTKPNGKLEKNAMLTLANMPPLIETLTDKTITEENVRSNMRAYQRNIQPSHANTVVGNALRISAVSAFFAAFILLECSPLMVPVVAAGAATVATVLFAAASTIIATVLIAGITSAVVSHYRHRTTWKSDEFNQTAKETINTADKLLTLRKDADHSNASSFWQRQAKSKTAVTDPLLVSNCAVKTH